PALKLRVFGKNNMVHRAMLNISYAAEGVDVNGAKANVNSFGIALGYGIEKVFEAAERLNTYVGADANIGFVRAAGEAGKNDISQSGFGFGIKAFTGMDYYVLPKVYLGMELGYGIGFNTYGATKMNGVDNKTTSARFSLTPYVTPVFRLGYILTSKKVRSKQEPSYRSRYYENDDE